MKVKKQSIAMKLIVVTNFILVSCLAYSQSISNVASIQQGNNAIVTYDLNGATGSTYFVKIYYSTDGGQNFSHELTQVTGDVKSGVKPGSAKKIIWSADKEVNYLNGPVIFKVEGEVRKALPKPVTVNGTSVEIINAKRNGDELTIDFLLTQNTESEKKSFGLHRDSEITGLDGKQYKPISGKFGSVSSIEHYNESDCIKGIPVKGYLTFHIEGTDLVIPAIKIAFSWGREFIIKNIPIE